MLFHVLIGHNVPFSLFIEAIIYDLADIAPAWRDVAPSAVPSRPRLPFVNQWNAYCKHTGTNVAGRTCGRTQRRGDEMKIYLLMLLVSAIAALSHVDLGRKSPRHET
jgi:hypothetical protein